MPKGKHVNLNSVDAIVEVITNLGEMQAPDTSNRGAQDQRANARLRAQWEKSLREILIKGFGCEIAIFVPPLSGPINMGLCAFADADIQ